MRGSRPGERRGGRKKGTPNKKTAYVRAVMAAHAANPTVTPMDVMLAVVRDPHVALEMRVKMALKALPHLHRKLRAGEPAPGAGEESLPALRRKKLSPEARIDAPSIESPVNHATKLKSNGGRPNKGEKPKSVATPSLASGDVLTVQDEGGQRADLKPLPFLLEVLNDAKAPPAIKVKVSLATLPYTHPRQSTRPPKPTVVIDRFGFTVEPALARKLRNEIARLSVLKKRRNPHPRDQKAMQKLNKKIDAKLATLECPCPSCYSAGQAAEDKEKIEYLWRKRRSRRKLTPNEDAELAHINARYCAFARGSEVQARARLRVLKAKERTQRLANGRPLNPWEKGGLNVLTILYPPEISAQNADREAFLERESIFSECPFDSDGHPLEYRRLVGPAPETISTALSEAAAAQPDDPGPQPQPEPVPEEDFEESSKDRPSAPDCELSDT
jgi:hypothetical protein